MGTTTPVVTGAVTVTVTPTGELQLDPNNGDVTMSPDLDTITYTLVNADPEGTARFTNTALGESDPWYLIRSAGPSGKLSYARDSDTQLTVTDDNRNHGAGQDWMYKYGIRVMFTDGNGNSTLLTFDPTIDDETGTG
jgi:hypothetical protein